MKRPISAVWGAGLSLAASFFGNPAQAGTPFEGATYDCTRGVTVQASYLNTYEDSYAVIFVEGQLVALQNVQSASGAKYAQSPNGAGYVWWTKGNEAILLWVDPATNTDDMILKDCKAR